MGTMFAATTKSADAPDVAADIYDAKFEGVTTKFIEGGQYGDGERYVWLFTLLDDDGSVLYDKGDPIQLDALTSMSLNRNSKTQPKALRYFYAVASPEERAAFDADEEVDMDALIGRKAQVEVAIRDNGWPTIVNVLPARGSRRRAASAVGALVDSGDGEG